MCSEVKQIQKVASTFIKQDLNVLELRLTRQEKIDFVNSVITLQVAAEHMKRVLVA